MVRILPEAARATNILILDIERLPGLAEVWDQKTRFVPASKFKRLPRTICFAAGWYGRPGVEFHSEWNHSHIQMIRRSWELYDQADIVYTYNGKRFDTPHLRTDWAKYGFGEPSPFKGGRPVPGQQDLLRPCQLLPAAPGPRARHPRQGRPLRLRGRRACRPRQ